MKRFFSCLLRFFWSWGFLKFVIFMITLVVLFYVEEDWRGARAWAATKAKWEGRGVSFDLNTYLPPPVPDSQNLAALPIFKIEPDPDPDPQMHGYLVPLALQRAFTPNSGNVSFSGLGDWEHGKTTDMKKFRDLVAAQYAATFPGRAPAADALGQFAQLYPFVSELREASATRPFFRIAQTYEFIDHPKESNFRLVTDQIGVSKCLTWDAILALNAGKSDQALADIKINAQLVRGVMDQPTLVAGLVGIGMTAINLAAVYDGLAAHAWSDAQLEEIERELARLDFLAAYPRDMRGECLLMLHAYGEMEGNRFRITAPNQGVPPVYFTSGWFDLLKTQMADFELTQIGYFHLEERRVDAPGINRFMDDAQPQPGWNSFSIWSILSGVAAGPIIAAAEKYSEMQVWVDEARIACALERYRLAHGAYPARLDALAPEFIDAVPHDVMNGEPYHYRLNADGTFLLYSVGWNQRDDGGVEVKKDNGPSRDYLQGDWPWPMPKH
jgi:hypothetical protein